MCLYRDKEIQIKFKLLEKSENSIARNMRNMARKQVHNELQKA